MRRVSVVGTPGAGKSTFAAALAAALGVDHVELDAIFHQRGWTELAVPEFRERVTQAISADGWVVDGNYSTVLDVVWTCADTVVWLDLPRRVVMYRMVIRTLARVILRQELWNGNRERWRNVVSVDPMRSIIAWAWTRHPVYCKRYEAAMADPANRHLRFERLSSAQEISAFLTATCPD